MGRSGPRASGRDTPRSAATRRSRGSRPTESRSTKPTPRDSAAAFAEAKCDQLEQLGYRFGTTPVAGAGTDCGDAFSRARTAKAGFATGAAAGTGTGTSTRAPAGATGS